MKIEFCPKGVLSISRIAARSCWLLVMFVLLSNSQRVMGATIISTVPANGATGVSPAAPVVFTFSAAMNPTVTLALISDATATFAQPPVTSAWSSDNTVLTCTPSPQFANNHNIQWQVSGQDALGNPLTGTTSGAFTTIPGVNGGSGTNADTSFLVLEYSLFHQTSTAPPAHTAFEFNAQSTLSSNRTATNITVTLPTSAVSNLLESALSPERFSLALLISSQGTFSSNFPAGDYAFNVKGNPDQLVTVTLPAYSYPNAPMVSNYTAAQSINPSQPFTLTWNTFTNGTSGDWIFFLVSLGSATSYQSPVFGQPGALNGTATSFTIPAGTLQANSNYTAEVAFVHVTQSTNGSSISASAVGSVTGFSISTTNGGSAAPLLTISRLGTNVALAWPTNAGGFALEYATNLASPVWSSNLPTPAVVSTNNVVTNSISGTQRFFRLVNP